VRALRFRHALDQVGPARGASEESSRSTEDQSLGRATANDVAIDDRTLAEHHAQIVFDGKRST